MNQSMPPNELKVSLRNPKLTLSISTFPSKTKKTTTSFSALRGEMCKHQPHTPNALRTTKICLLLPAYNESQRIGQVIQEASAFISDIVVIDDGSTDSTGEIAADNGAFCLTQTPNRGKGFALRKGFAYALANGYNAVFTMDSDGQHAPADIPRFLEHFARTQPDILIGARVRARETMPLHRRINNAFISWVGSQLCGQTVPDFQSGYRLIRATVLEKIQLKTERYETESELLIQAGRRGFRIEWLPIAARYGDYRSDIKPLREIWLFTKLLIRSL